MSDREKVIGHLYDCLAASKPENLWVFVRKDIVGDALNLLKEQEPVKPVVNVDEWVCGCCGLSVEQQRMIHPGAIFHDFFEYCPHCGKKVDWEAVKQDD